MGIALGTNYGDNSQEAIAEANRQSYICFATFLVLAGVSVLYLIYRFCINFVILSNKIDETKRCNIKKINFALAIVNLLSLAFLMFFPLILSASLSRVSLMPTSFGSFFMTSIFPLAIPIGFGIYYLLSSDFWNKEETVDK